MMNKIEDISMLRHNFHRMAFVDLHGLHQCLEDRFQQYENMSLLKRQLEIGLKEDNQIAGSLDIWDEAILPFDDSARNGCTMAVQNLKEIAVEQTTETATDRFLITN
ncbi:hypothetical protein TNCV_3659591 [Trichonephila clavipes]|nr:hypothetical protein TNCV_3659591 [Trichonephila clavipes]